MKNIIETIINARKGLQKKMADIVHSGRFIAPALVLTACCLTAILAAKAESAETALKASEETAAKTTAEAQKAQKALQEVILHGAKPIDVQINTNKMTICSWLKAKSGSLSSCSCTKDKDKKNEEARAAYEQTLQVCREAVQASQSNK